MKTRNIWRDVAAPLELHEDARGTITDIFFNAAIHHVAVIDSKKGVLRGDHYHEATTQHILITKGSLEYWYQPIHSKEPAKCIVAKIGDVVSTPPYEVHALRILEDNQFIVFSQGTRGGPDYEKDTFRVMPTIIGGLEDK